MKRTKVYSRFRLLDQDDSEKALEGEFIQTETGQLLLKFEGYGDCNSNDGEGQPIALELYRGKLRVIVWGDINQEDPTHTIDVNGALESVRSEDLQDLKKKWADDNHLTIHVYLASDLYFKAPESVLREFYKRLKEGAETIDDEHNWYNDAWDWWITQIDYDEDGTLPVKPGMLAGIHLTDNDLFLDIGFGTKKQFLEEHWKELIDAIGEDNG